MPRIDAHHHLWKYNAEEYGWIDDSMSVLRRDFLLDDLRAACHPLGIDGAVTVQARQSLEETYWLLDIAVQSDFVKGVVGWAPLCDADVPRELELLRQHPKLRGIRHVVQGEPDPFFLLRPDFNAGISALENTGLAYDVLIYERHLPVTIKFVDSHPNQVFILDHVAKPRISDGVIQPWKNNLIELAKRENVYCKLSGMVTEASWQTWSEQDLAPYLDAALEAFGPSRLMFGSDWPVCLLASSYKRWFNTLEAFLAQLSQDEQERIYGRTAVEAYRITATQSTVR